jgi:hypothetical protein
MKAERNRDTDAAHMTHLLYSERDFRNPAPYLMAETRYSLKNKPKWLPGRTLPIRLKIIRSLRVNML